MTCRRRDLEHWHLLPDPGGWGERDGWHAADHGHADWLAITAPFSLAAQGGALGGYRGPFWCRCRLDEPIGEPDERWWLELDAVHHEPRLWLDGRPVDQDLLPFLPGRVAVPTGAHAVALRLEGLPGPTHLEHPGRGWRHEAGIFGGAALQVTGPAWIETVALDARPTDTGGTVAGSLVCAGALEGGDEIRLRWATGEERLPATVTTIAVDLPGAPRWTPSSPALVPLEVALVRGKRMLDRRRLRLGFRRVAVADGRLLLDDEPLVPVGFNYHRDTPAAGMALDPAATRADLEAMQAAGATCVRLCHYPHPRRTLAACDELGLVALAELPLAFWPGTDDAAEAGRIAALARRQLAGLIGTLRHHPSVILWSVGNENHENRPEVRALLAELAALARTLDPTRPATHVSNHWRDHPSFEADDLICINHYPGWAAFLPWGRPPAADVKTLERAVAADWREAIGGLRQRHPDKPVLVTEFGYPSCAGIPGGPWGEERQAAVLAAEAAGMTDAAGAIIWIWADHPWPPPTPDVRRFGKLSVAPFGVVDHERRPKAALAGVPAIFAALARRR